VTIEIERKFMVADLPAVGLLGPGVQIRQGYIAEDGPVTVRVRITDARATLTVKAGSGLARTEVDVEITNDQAEALWPYTVGRRLDKTRHRVDLVDGGRQHVADVDVYAGSLEGLCVVEVEFGAEADAAAFNPPEWFGEELTEAPGWSNAALARHGRPVLGAQTLGAQTSPTNIERR
jgi:adenylate cyclase